MPFPSVSIIIPTLNSERTLRPCLESISMQDYPHRLLEVIIADAGSTDRTLRLVKDFGATSHIRTVIYENALKTGEAGKAVGVKRAKNELVALIDSDNILPDAMWLAKMVKPFEDAQIFACEPIEYTYRREDSYLTRYCALMGLNDPLCYFMGNYDRKNYISLRWTGVPVKGKKIAEDPDEAISGETGYLGHNNAFQYIKVELRPEALPTIGANGTIIRRVLIDNLVGDYFFDIDIIYELVKEGHPFFAKVNVGIIHLFGGNLQTFYRKQIRRVRDYMYFKKESTRSYPWQIQGKKGVVLFVLCCLVLFPLFAQSVMGFLNKRDNAWFLHPVFCWLTIYAYGWGTIASIFSNRALSRAKWTQ